MEAKVEGTYVRIHGQFKGFDGKKKLMVFGIKPVIDFDENTHHFVECIYVHSYNTKLMKQQASSSNSALIPSAGVNAQSYQTAPPNQFNGQYVADWLTGIQQLVRDYLHTPACIARENGVHQEEIAMQLCMPVDEIRTLDTERPTYTNLYSLVSQFLQSAMLT